MELRYTLEGHSAEFDDELDVSSGEGEWVWTGQKEGRIRDNSPKILD